MSITPGRWIVEAWSLKESQVVAIQKDGSAVLICAGVMPDDAELIAAAGNKANEITDEPE